MKVVRVPSLLTPLVLLVLSAASPARAEDWLAALPECAALPGSARQRAQGPAFEYPRPGLPAVVAAGERLVIRIQLPVPLTPPPGIQQSRALREYTAELRARTPTLMPASTATSAKGASEESAAHRYPVEVIGVRPEGASTLRYRVTVHVPAWAAPGVYALSLVAAGVQLPGEAPVVVLAQGAAPRLRPLEDEVHAEQGAATLPDGARVAIDVWVRTDAPGVQEVAAGDTGQVQTQAQATAAAHERATTHLGVPVLDTHGLVAALRMGGGLLVLGDCPGPHLPFMDEVRSLLGTERRSRLATPAYAAPLESLAPLAPSTVAGGEAAPALLQLHTERSADGGLVLRARTTRALELSFVITADGRQVRASGGVLDLYPATELPQPGRVPTLVVRWRLPAGGHAELAQAGTIARAAPRMEIELQPNPVRSGHLLRVSPAPQHAADGTAPTPLLAVRFDERSTAYGSGEANHRYTALGPARMQALAIRPDGTAVSGAPVVEVMTEAALGCSAAGVRPQLQQPGGAGAGLGLGLWAALWLLKRRPPRSAGNRLGARSRCWGQSPRRAPFSARAARAADLEPEPS